MADRKELLAALERDIAERLRPICREMPEQEFEQLVREIAEVKLKYAKESELSPEALERRPKPPGTGEV